MKNNEYCKASHAIHKLNYLEWDLKEQMQWEGKKDAFMN